MIRLRTFLASLVCFAFALNVYSQDVQRDKPRSLPTLRVASSERTRAPLFDLSFIRDMNHVSWGGGDLVVFEKSSTEHPIVHAFGKDGIDNPAVIDIPGAAIINVERASHGADGSLAACGMAVDSAGHGSGFVYLSSPDRQAMRVIRMSGLYIPQAIAVASDGSVWVLGWEPGEPTNHQINLEARVIRHLESDGKLQGEFISTRSVLEVIDRGALTSTPSYLAVTSARLGWIQDAVPSQYFEVLKDGEVLQYPGVPIVAHNELISGLAITERGEVFVSSTVFGRCEKAKGEYLYRLNRESRQWEEVQWPTGTESERLEVLRGAEGNTLVFSTRTPNKVQSGAHLLLTLR